MGVIIQSCGRSPHGVPPRHRRGPTWTMADLHPLDPSSSQHSDLQLRVQPRRGMEAAVPLPVAKDIVVEVGRAVVQWASSSKVAQVVSWVEEGGAAAAASKGGCRCWMMVHDSAAATRAHLYLR
ncbi:uncharacterized protein [Miscanthus floridulus]|uniref:uncharacterized protein n=1 Tax=Miscanthus floridulus TaxID=154761 RepID=UPI00345AB280